jgi:nucleoside-diphosphate-sugar epimerase
MKVLFIGGTGIISSACSALALERGIDLHLLCRGKSHRGIPPGAKVLTGDIRDPASVKAALGGRSFDAVVDWIAFTTAHIEVDLELFRGRCGQLLFISSASAYQTPPASLPVTESTPLDNPFWQYSRDKIACEERLWRAFREEKYPVTIVRPSHTYDRTLIPLHGGWANIERMRAGKPIVIHGDGTSLWTLTHHRDFAKGLVGLLGHSRAIGDHFHITGDEAITWDEISRIMASAAGAPPPKLVHMPSETIAAWDPGWGASLLGDKTHSMVFDNTKVKRLVPDFVCTTPFSRGAEEILGWYDADQTRRGIDQKYDALVDRLVAAQRAALPEGARAAV